MAETLETIIRRRAPVPVAEKLTWMMTLCAELVQAHAAGIVHGDIKPASLAVDDQGRLTILDLGAARPPATQAGAPAAAGYKAPEQIEGGQVDHRADLFAVGAVCYELLAYTPAFSGSSVEQVERSVLAGTPAPLVSRLPDLDPEVDEVVLRALKRDPNKRYQDAATFERALGRVRDRVRERTQAVDSAPTVVALPSPTVAGTTSAPQPPPPATPVAAPRPGAGRRFRSARAEAAYRRALDASRSGAIDAARRFAAEAVAEDPSSPEARELLARLGGRTPRAEGGTPPRPAPASEPTVAGTWTQGPSGGVSSSAPTIVASRREPAMPPASAPTIISPRPGASPGPSASLPTIIVDPGSSGAGSSGATVALEREPSRREAAPVPGSHQPLWVRHRVAVLVTALLVIGAIAAGVVVIGLRFLEPAGPQLTVQKPAGGTLAAPGILCGTGGTDCTENVAANDRIELEARPDQGYTFGSFTGDCAPSGRVTMSGPRTCGATFVPMTGTPVETATQLLTISPVPAGGTVVGVEINCGSRGTTCSGNYPVDQDEDLNPMPDEGYSFMGFAGDCTRDGRVKMSGARTCTATFAPTPIATTSVPFVPDSQRQARRNPTSDRGKTTTDGGAGGQQPTAGPDGTPQGTTAGQTPPGGPGGQGTTSPLTPPAAGPTQKIQEGDAVKPPTDEDYAKSRIKQLLVEWCAAYQAIDPDAVQRLYPLVDMTALRMQLNKEKYRSVQCKIGEPEYLSLDAGAGRAKVKVELTRVYQHTILTKKKETSELVATVTLTRPGERSQWRIDAATYEPK